MTIAQLIEALRTFDPNAIAHVRCENSSDIAHAIEHVGVAQTNVVVFDSNATTWESLYTEDNWGDEEE